VKNASSSVGNDRDRVAAYRSLRVDDWSDGVPGPPADGVCVCALR
jgi:hypothetical protein